MIGVFAEFERGMIAERVPAGMARAWRGASSPVKAIGRFPIDPRRCIHQAHEAGSIGLRGVAAQFGVSVATVRRSLSSEC